MVSVSAQHSEHILLLGLRKRDRKVLTKIYREFFPQIKKHVLSYGGSQEDAEDVFQDAMVVLYRKVDDAEFHLSSKLGTYLFAIGKRIWLHKISRSSKRPQTGLEQAPGIQAEDLDAQMEKTEKYRLFREKLLLLGKDCQEVLQLFFVKTSMTDIAQKMGYASEGYAKKRKFQCKKKLTDLIKSDRRFQEIQQ